MEVDGQEGFDEQLYNRQTYAIGADAQKRLGKTDVLLCGMTGLGLEIAKNIILTGVRSVTLFDPDNVKWNDLSSAFYFTEDDVGSNRVDSCVSKLQELNKYVRVSKLDKSTLTHDDIRDWKGASVAQDSESQQVIVYIDHPTSQLKEVNSFCRENGVKFISSESRGLAGCIFVDDGPEHTVFDVDGEEVKSLLVTGITSDSSTPTVTIQDNARHDLSDGDAVMFTDLPDLPALHNDTVEVSNPIVFRVKVKSPICFILYTEGSDGNLIPFDTSSMRYSRGGYVTQVKLPKKMKFDPLEQSLCHPEFLITDFAKMDAPGTLHLLFLALHEFEKLHGHLPAAHNSTHADEVLQLAKTFHSGLSSLSFDDDLIVKLAAVSSGNINPMAAILGGFTAHEVLKAASGKFTPIHQWFYFDARELLMSPSPAPETCQPQCNRYDGSVAIFGSEFQKRISTSKLFVVGSGALGCEFLKNFSMMGVGTDSGGVVVTDMDGIEKSNLSRQFLFRTKDIGSLKSEVAAAAANAMNPDMKIKHLTEKVAPETEHIFNDDFWESLDVVVNALDNVIARLFVDAQCVHYRKPLLESGTLGSKGNVQVVVPHITESYGTKRDPPEQSIPHCTLKNFPNAIEHTIQWARDSFEGLFTNVPRDVNCYINDQNFLNQLEAEANTRQATLNGIRHAMIVERPKSFQDCIGWARRKFDAFFTNEILQLLHNFPLDRRSNEGELFWSGPKRPPQAIMFDPNDQVHASFVASCANLQAAIYSIDGSRDIASIADYAAKVQVDPFMPKKVHIQTEENEKVQEDTAAEMTAEEIIALLPQREGQQVLNEVEFEKDDDSNHHIDFITACSNLRARNFKIPEANRSKTKQIAGKIIPAMVTTTALVTGLVGIELLKVLRGDKTIEAYKSAFLNLAIPFLTLSEPGEVPKNKYGPESNPRHWTLWDRFDIDVGRDITLKELIQWFEDNHQLEINMMSAGTSMIYSFFSKKAEVRRRMAMKMSELVREISKQEFTDSQKYIPMEVSAEYEGEDAEVPSVRYRFRF